MYLVGILPLIVWVCLQSNFAGGFIKRFLQRSCVSAAQGHPRSFWHQSKARTCDFLLVHRSISARLVLSCTVSEMLQVFVLKTPLLFHPNFGSVRVGPDRPRWVRPSRSLKQQSAVKLFSKYSNVCDHST